MIRGTSRETKPQARRTRSLISARRVSPQPLCRQNGRVDTAVRIIQRVPMKIHAAMPFSPSPQPKFTTAMAEKGIRNTVARYNHRGAKKKQYAPKRASRAPVRGKFMELGYPAAARTAAA